MGRRIRWLGIILVACMGLVIAQLVNIQLVKAKALQTSPNNPRVAVLTDVNPRGEILAADGTVLAHSVKTPKSVSKATYPFDYVREYPQGPLYAGITGYWGPYYAGTGIEQSYSSYLGPHQQAPQTFSQLLFREKMPTTTDNVTLTVQPALQQAAWNALTTSVPGGNNDGAVVVMQPSTGNILAMVSNPTFDPNSLVGTTYNSDKLAYFSYNQPDHEGYVPLRPLATEKRFPPGSTMKVVTTTAIYNYNPSLATYNYPQQKCQPFSDGKPVCDSYGACGGTVQVTLPVSCDSAYAYLGVQVGVDNMTKQAQMFGYDSVPGIDVPAVEPSVFPKLPPNSQALLGQSSIGQYDVAATALQNAMVAAAVANHGVLMTPHLMSSVTDSQGAKVETYSPHAASQVSSAQTAQQVTSLMEAVTQPPGTAAGIFPSYLCAAVKTGTAQTVPGGPLDDWMIGFAPANNPQVAVAVVVPQQARSTQGATIAGPIMKSVMQAAVPQSSVSQPCSTSG